MAQIEVLSPRFSPIDFHISCSPTENSHIWGAATAAWVNEILSSSPLRITAESPLSIRPADASRADEGSNDTGTRQPFPSLPPLLHGHPDLHVRQGIMNASRLADAHEPDAEKAFFVGDISQVYKQHLRWKSCLPDIEPFYAVKCNPDPYVLRLLAALGTGFDCASNGEISQVLSLGGISPNRIIFANPCKANSFIRNAAKMGVDMMTFDNVDELHKISRIHPKAKLVIRILTDDTKSLCRLGIKFGAALPNVPGLLAKAKELALDIIGVSFHVGSGCYDPTVFSDAIARARQVFDMGDEAGYSFSLLDVGGGFEDATFEQAARVLNAAIDKYFPDRHRRGIRMIAEPGRFYVSKAFTLAANIIARRAAAGSDDTSSQVKNDSGEDQPTVMYYINDGVYGAFNCILFDHQVVHPYVLSLSGSFHIPPSLPSTLSSVWGPTCDSIDCVNKAVVLPSALRVGDWLGFENMGAYTMCAASQFNGFETSKVVYTTGSGSGSREVGKILARFAEEGYGL